MRSLSLFLLFFVTLACFGQDPIGGTINGTLIDLRGSAVPIGNALTIEGSPYFSANWSKGTITLSNKKKYERISVKLNLHTDDVLFIAEDTKNEMIALKGSVLEIEVSDPEKNDKLVLFRSGYPSVQSNSQKTYYNVLVDGRVSLLKQIKKTIIEEKPFNSASVIQKYKTEKFYFLFVNNSMALLKKKKDDLLNLLSAQKEKVDAFINTNKLNVKSDDDLVRIVEFYNSL
jgi:hypothetical protein